MKVISSILVIGVALLLAVSPSKGAESDPASPYGVCSHLGGGEEHNLMPKNLQVMYQGGIRWARADYTWTGVEFPQGQWHFQGFDRLIDQAEANGITILPILDYGAPWATPAWKHLDQWSEYVRRTVTRYKDRIRYWEVWNEENLRGFWADTPDGANYATLLKKTYEVIKSIDPDLKVVYGGLAGVPADYFEASLKAGAGPYFDIMNIHPYRGGLVSVALTQNFCNDIEKINLLMDKYNIKRRPIWITEMGWATPPVFSLPDRKILDASLKILFPKGVTGKAAVLYDPIYEPSMSISDSSISDVFPKDLAYDFVKVKDLKSLDVKRYPILYLPPSEVAPSPFFADIVRYVKEGGTLVLFGGVPLYYNSQMTDGVIRQEQRVIGDIYRNQLRIGWRAWWTVKDTPEKAPLQVSKEAQEAFKGYFPVMDGTRFFTDRLLRPGDKMIPLLNGKLGDFEAPSAVIYKFNSDMKGNVIASMLMGSGNGTNICNVENQGVFLPQAMLIAFASGIERYFWYEFQAMEQDDVDKEHHFGMVHRDLSPKSGYIAYKTLVKARPSGSVQDSKWLTGKDNCLVKWKRPDGQNGFALWTPTMEKTVAIKIQGKVTEAFDYLGNSVSLDANTKNIKLTSKILYLIGPDSVELEEK